MEYQDEERVIILLLHPELKLYELKYTYGREIKKYC